MTSASDASKAVFLSFAEEEDIRTQIKEQARKHCDPEIRGMPFYFEF
jgi:hypothetical protein